MKYKLTNYKGIIQAIANLAIATHDDPAYLTATGQLPYLSNVPGSITNVPSLTRNGSKLYEVPSKVQIDAAGGPPFFAVRFGTLSSYALGGVPQTADTAAKGPSVTEPVWDWEIYSFHPYDPDDPNYDDAASDMCALWQAFQAPENERLGGACQSCYVVDASPAYVELLSGDPYTAAYLVIRTGEYLGPAT